MASTADEYDVGESEAGFYRTRDQMAGGTENDYEDQADFDFRGNMPSVDAAPYTVSGPLSQSSLAG